MPSGGKRAVILGSIIADCPVSTLRPFLLPVSRLRGTPIRFSSFKTFHTSLGFRMKEPNEKRPSRSHTLLSILWTFVPEGAWASPGPERVAKLVVSLSECLQKGGCSALSQPAWPASSCSFVRGFLEEQALLSLLKPRYRQFVSRGRAPARVLHSWLKLCQHSSHGCYPASPGG